MKIRFILDIYSSKADVYGNRYHVAQLTSTRTGRCVWFRAHSEDNARHAFARALGQRPSEFMHITEQTLPIREFNRLVKRAPVIGDESAIQSERLDSFDGRVTKPVEPCQDESGATAGAGASPRR